MSPTEFASISMDEVPTGSPASESADWLWQGFVARSNLTLLTSLWKAGKTTLLTGLLQQLAKGGSFLGQSCQPAKALVISEESTVHWSPRLAIMPIGSHVRLLSRPFLQRPTPELWRRLIDQAGDRRAAGELDLLIVDSLAAFLPGGHENDAGTLLDMLQPLQRLATAGAAVMILHHPRKQRAEEGHTARGSGALLAFVDIILELHRYGRLSSDDQNRRLISLSRYRDTPSRVIYHWNPSNGAFTLLDDINEQRFRHNWDKLQAILADRTEAATPQELLADWPSDQTPPSVSMLYEWLNRATQAQLVRRGGAGRKKDPYRFRLPNEDDEYYDRGELPPLRELNFSALNNAVVKRLSQKRR